MTHVRKSFVKKLEISHARNLNCIRSDVCQSLIRKMGLGEEGQR
jgi:hypothetical protein